MTLRESSEGAPDAPPSDKPTSQLLEVLTYWLSVLLRQLSVPHYH